MSAFRSPVTSPNIRKPLLELNKAIMCRASVLIPTHEHAATLPFAIGSVQQQGVDDIEILVVVDGVDDEVRAAVKQLQARDRAFAFSTCPRGQETAKSIGMQCSLARLAVLDPLVAEYLGQAAAFIAVHAQRRKRNAVQQITRHKMITPDRHPGQTLSSA